MADALLSPAVGGAMWAASAGTLAYCAKKVREEGDDRKVPLMGVLGAFIFASQMLNFTIPVTGSSGHLGGGMILAILLGPYAAFLVMASVLTVQALFFADGGLLALGCNIFNLGFFPAFIGLPLYRRLAGTGPTQGRLAAACMVSAIVGLQLGAFAVVLETVSSGISELPFRTFVALMQPIHLAIGVVEGLVTAAVVSFVWKAQPGILEVSASGRPLGTLPARKVLAVLAVFALLAGGALSWFASTRPDGLEWSMEKVSGKEELEGRGAVHAALASLQEKAAFLPDYGFGKRKGGEAPSSREPAAQPGSARITAKEEAPAPWPAVDAGTSLAGIVGGSIVLGLVFLVGFLLRRRAGGGAGRAGGSGAGL